MGFYTTWRPTDPGFVFSDLKNLSASSFSQTFVGFHYDNESPNLIGWDKQTNFKRFKRAYNPFFQKREQMEGRF